MTVWTTSASPNWVGGAGLHHTPTAPPSTQFDADCCLGVSGQANRKFQKSRKEPPAESLPVRLPHKSALGDDALQYAQQEVWRYQKYVLGVLVKGLD